MSIDRFTGTGVALVTPFKEDLSIDFEALEKVIAHVSDGGVEYLVVMGTTGESPTVTWKEKLEVLEFVLANNPKDLPVVFGHGGNNTRDLIDKLEDIRRFPLTALLSASPYYNKPGQEGIYQHYRALADESPFPVILYNIPARTSSKITTETTLRLAAHGNIIGTKEASGDLIQCAEIRHQAPDFLLISGDDALSLPVISLGGHGVISVMANLQPVEFSKMVRAALSGDYPQAQRLNNELLEGYELVSAEGNPVSVKTGLEVLGLMRSDVRLPLVKGTEKLRTNFRDYLGH